MSRLDLANRVAVLPDGFGVDNERAYQPAFHRNVLWFTAGKYHQKREKDVGSHVSSSEEKWINVDGDNFVTAKVGGVNISRPAIAECLICEMLTLPTYLVSVSERCLSPNPTSVPITTATCAVRSSRPRWKSCVNPRALSSRCANLLAARALVTTPLTSTLRIS